VDVASSVTRLRPLWVRAKPVLQPLLFLGGALFDYVTLELHSVIDQLLLVAYLVAVVVLYGLDMRLTRGLAVPDGVERYRDLLDYAGALLLGALLSALAIVVLRAVYPGPTIIFVALLLGMAIANEADVPTLRGDLLRFGLVGFFGFQVGSLLAPFVLGRLVGPGYGVATAAAAVLGLLLLAVLGRTASPRHTARDVAASLGAGGAGVAAVLGLQILQVVPPLPVVLRQTEVAHDVTRVDGEVRFEDRVRRGVVDRFLNRPATLRWSPGETVTVYTAIYAPPAVRLTTSACWDAWGGGEGWREIDCIEQPMRGGRVDGWRTWTRKENVWPGEWRVRLQIGDGREIGRVRFRLVETG